MKKLLALLTLGVCGTAFAAELKITLDADRTETDDIAIVADTDLDLAGHTINGRIWVDEGATLTISDSIGGGKIDNGKGSYTLIVRGTAILNSGTLVNAGASGVVCLNFSQAKPKFIMNGGEVKSTSVTTEAAAIFAGACTTDNGIVEIHGGTISGLVGISLAGRNQLIMDGGEILNKVAPSTISSKYGIYLACDNDNEVTVLGGKVGGLTPVAREAGVETMIGSKLKGGYYSKKPGEWAIATGYIAKKTNAVAGYPYTITYEIAEYTVTMKDEEGENKNIKIDVPQTYVDKFVNQYIEDLDDPDIESVDDLDDDQKDEIKAQVNEALNTECADGMTTWQKVQLGLDANANLAVCELKSSSETEATVALSKVSTIESNGDLTISYSLKNSEGTVLGPTQSTPVFNVDLSELSKDNPIGAWTITADFVATKSAEGETIEVSASAHAVNTVGAVCVENTSSSVLLSTPWMSVEGDKTPIKVTDMVDTATLTEGDTLNVYNADGTYSTFKLSAQKTWQPVTTISQEGQTTPASNMTINPGQAVWLNRTGDTTKPIYMLGQVETTDKAIATPPAGTAEEPVATILGNPKPEATIISAETTIVTGDASKDQILVTEGNTFRRYVRNSKGELGYYEVNETTGKKKFVKVDELTIPAGEAFWYQSEGGSITIK